MTDWIGWIILLPLLLTSVLIAAKFSAYLAEAKTEKYLKISASVAYALLALYLLILTVQYTFQDTPLSITLGDWLTSGDFSIPLSFILDFNSLVSSVAFATILAVLFWFTPLNQSYYSRYYFLYSLFGSALFLLLLADQWLLTLIAWEMTAIAVYLILFYSHAEHVLVFKQDSVFYLGRLSSFFLLLAVLLSSSWLNINHWHDLEKAVNGLNTLQAIVLMSFFLLAIMTRLLSFSCILRYLEINTNRTDQGLKRSVKSSTMIPLMMMIFTLLSTLYILIRLAPLFQQAALLQGFFAVFGLIFALAAGLQSFVSSDTGRRLLLQSLSHSGFILMLCSLGFFLIAFAYLLMYSLVVSRQILQLQPDKLAHPPKWLQKRKGLYALLLRGFLPARFPSCD